MANRRITELQAIAGTSLAEDDLFTVVHVSEVDPTLKNRKLTISGTKDYLNAYYFPRTGGTVSGAVIVQGNLTVSGSTNFSAATFTGAVTVGSLIAQSGIVASGTISGATITGSNVQGTNVNGVLGNFTTITGEVINVTSGNFLQKISGVTITGVSGAFTTLTGATGVFTTSISGATVTGNAVLATTVTGATGTFTTVVSGLTVTGNTGLFSNLTGTTAVFVTSISGATITGNTGQFTTLTGGTAGFTSVTGTTISGTTLNVTTVNATNGNFANIVFSGTTVSGNLTVSGSGFFGSGVSVTGTISGQTVTGTTANFTSGNFTTLSGISVGNTSATVTDTGTDGAFTVVTEGGTALTINAGQTLFGKGFSTLLNYYSVSRGSNNSSMLGHYVAGGAGNNPGGPLLWSCGNTAADSACELTFLRTKSNVSTNLTGQTTANDVLGYINFLGTDATSTRPCASIQAYSEIDILNTSSPGRLVFGTTTAGATTISEKLRLDSNGFATHTGAIGRGAPVTKTGNFTLAIAENWIICNGTATITATLPAASSWTGREVMLKTIAAFTVVSASSNVVPLAGGAAGTAILAATAGKYATLVSDGTNWIIMNAN